MSNVVDNSQAQANVKTLDANLEYRQLSSLGTEKWNDGRTRLPSHLGLGEATGEMADCPQASVCTAIGFIHIEQKLDTGIEALTAQPVTKE